MFNIQCAFIIREQRAFFEQKVWIYTIKFYVIILFFGIIFVYLPPK